MPLGVGCRAGEVLIASLVSVLMAEQRGSKRVGMRGGHKFEDCEEGSRHSEE